MVRTQIYLTEEERDGLASLAESTGKKQSELIREAVDDLIHRSSDSYRAKVVRETAGMWRSREDLPDFERLRKEWDRD
jgi:predicted DNA-binding protein